MAPSSATAAALRIGTLILMDTRQVGQAVRRRVGQSCCSYAPIGGQGDGLIRNTPIATDYGVIEAAFAARKGDVVASDHVRDVADTGYERKALL